MRAAVLLQKGTMKLKKKFDKEILEKLYLKEKKTTREIAQMLDCSYNTVNYWCRKYGIKLRSQTCRRVHFDKSTLERLYSKEEKTQIEAAEILSCSYVTVRKRCREYGIHLREKRIKGVTKALLEKLYVQENKSSREVAKILDCSCKTVLYRCRQYGIPLKKPGRQCIKNQEM
jgi:transcriptional regulator of aromatic amino acid metabolism